MAPPQPTMHAGRTARNPHLSTLMASSTIPNDRKTSALIARSIDDAWLEAGFHGHGPVEDDWSEMAEAIAQAVADGVRDGPQL
jgi:hypothetical protein